MLDFSDAPYQFFPARPSIIIMGLCRFANSRWALPGRNHRVARVSLTGATDRVREIESRGERILFTPNHPTHSDPQVMTEAQRLLGTPSCYMAAYDVFLRSRVNAWVMQRAGAFSVDREGSDRKSMAEAIRVLTAGRFALTIFPEGNVYMMNDRVTPFLEGASFLALKAQKELGAGRPIHIVPVSIKLTHITDARPAVREKLGKLAGVAGERFDPDADPVSELMRIGRHLLATNLRQRGFIGRDEDISTPHLPDALKEGASRILTGLESKMDLAVKTGDDLIARLRRIRATIHQIRIDPEKEPQHRVAASWADEAILALRIIGYSDPYVAIHPTLDRFHETVEKLSEDLYGRWDPPAAPREALVQIGEPVNLAAWLEESESGGKSRQAVNGLTAEMEMRVQAGLDAINATNLNEGSKPF